MKNSGSELDEGGQNLLDNIGAAFVQFRQESGLTQRQVAEKAESSQARISGIENGKADIFLLTLRRWALVYGYDIEVSFVPIEDDAFDIESLFEEMKEENVADTDALATRVLSEMRP